MITTEDSNNKVVKISQPGRYPPCEAPPRRAPQLHQLRQAGDKVSGARLLLVEVEAQPEHLPLLLEVHLVGRGAAEKGQVVEAGLQDLGGIFIFLD